ncbi:MAG: hypothetical protein ACKO99_12090, partial [Dolichospermum sp.]
CFVYRYILSSLNCVISYVFRQKREFFYQRNLSAEILPKFVVYRLEADDNSVFRKKPTSRQ